MRILAAVAVVMTLAFGGGASAAPALWVVKDADSEIYLFGSMHMLQAGADWRTPAFEDAYDRATTVWFETDVDAPPEEVSKLMATYGLDPDRTLSQKLSPAALKALKPMLRRRPVSLAAIDHMRPWAAAMMLQVLPMSRRGYAVSSGVDAVVTHQAQEGAKTVRTFETLEDQVRIFASLPEAVEVQYLEDVIGGRDARQLGGAAIQAAWLAGDIETLGPGLVGAMKTDRPALYEAMLRRRNQAWAGRIAQEMAGSGVELVNVGALHMVGPDGLPALLAAKGFKVERVQ
ncbi:MAG TPA: TraB/GumN family protein [Caulobacteraceae bacterium]|nr:TraB/GumN family protein [Caulobacteraceae bacterium]